MFLVTFQQGGGGCGGALRRIADFVGAGTSGNVTDELLQVIFCTGMVLVIGLK